MRPCFLCGSPIEVLTEARWHLPALPDQAVGFGACRGCGLVVQAPRADAATLARYYVDSAVYTNPGRAGRPSAEKVRCVERTLHAVEHVLGRPPASAFQVGASDGYTLDRFRAAGAAEVSGVEPSAASVELARERYGVELAQGTIEAAADGGDAFPAELWILTHVLEHLDDPRVALDAARASQRPGQWMLAEVPLFERPDRLPPGWLSFEHLTYFAEDTLLALLARSGYEAWHVTKELAGPLYPIVSVVARRTDSATGAAADDDDRARAARRARRDLGRYLEREAALWRGVEERVHAALEPGTRTRVWGAGIHTSQLLAATDLADHLELVELLDSSPTKWGTRFGPWRCAEPASVAWEAGDAVLISSYAAEDEIARALEPLAERGVRVVRCHGAGAAHGEAQPAR